MLGLRSIGVLFSVVALSACTDQPFQRSANVTDSTCIRQAYVAEINLWAAVQDCGKRVPNLTGDTGLQRQASYADIPFIKEEHEADGKSRAYICSGGPPAFERLDTALPSVGRCTALGST